MNKQSKLIFATRIIEIIVGIYFLVGAYPKGIDIDKFAVQIAAYKVIQAPNMLMLSALFTLFVEVSLGISLVMGLRLKGLVILAMEGMLIFFAVLIIYAWRKHGLEDCGCFPFFKMSPQVSLFKNGLLIVSGIFILWAQKSGKSLIESLRQSLLPGKLLPITAKLAVAVLCGSAATAYAYHDIDWKSFEHVDGDTETLSYSQFILYLPEGYFNLGEGTYLVAVMSMTCDECMANVPDMNALLTMPDMPTLVALCYEDVPGDMEKFRAYTNPVFPMHSLGDRAVLYYKLIGDDSFRLSLIHNGTPLKWWDGHMPTYEDIIQAKNELLGKE